MVLAMDKIYRPQLWWNKNDKERQQNLRGYSATLPTTHTGLQQEVCDGWNWTEEWTVET
jgi:hypothetical protein